MLNTRKINAKVSSNSKYCWFQKETSFHAHAVANKAIISAISLRLSTGILAIILYTSIKYNLSYDVVRQSVVYDHHNMIKQIPMTLERIIIICIKPPFLNKEV